MSSAAVLRIGLPRSCRADDTLAPPAGCASVQFPLNSSTMDPSVAAELERQCLGQWPLNWNAAPRSPASAVQTKKPTGTCPLSESAAPMTQHSATSGCWMTTSMLSPNLKMAERH